MAEEAADESEKQSRTIIVALSEVYYFIRTINELGSKI
tara:strand:+ start:84 stop:197 length:114 start_codon:yes stop_codon:yes gene_type:complete